MIATCEACVHFRAHYVRRGRNWYFKTACGHCVYPHLKHRKADTPACVHFREKPDHSPETK